jgi:hypothetical protein
MHLDRAQTLRPTCLTWKWAKTCGKVLHILRIAHTWKGETSGARKDGNLHEMTTTDVGSGSDRHRGRICRATLAAALCARDRRADAWAIDALRQRLSPRVSRSRERQTLGCVWRAGNGRVCHLFLWNGAYCGLHLSLRQTLDSTVTDVSDARTWSLDFKCSWTRGTIMSDGRRYAVSDA